MTGEGSCPLAVARAKDRTLPGDPSQNRDAHPQYTHLKTHTGEKPHKCNTILRRQTPGHSSGCPSTVHTGIRMPVCYSYKQNCAPQNAQHNNESVFWTLLRLLIHSSHWNPVTGYCSQQNGLNWSLQSHVVARKDSCSFAEAVAVADKLLHSCSENALQLLRQTFVSPAFAQIHLNF